MAVYAAGQQIAQNPNPYQVGVPTQALLDGYTFGSIALNDLTVGNPCFYTGIADQTVQALGNYSAGIGGVLAGVVMRSNASAMAFGDSVLGFSTTISAGSNVQVQTRGSVPVPITTCSSTFGSPVRGDDVYVNYATGTWVVVGLGGTPPSNTAKTNFKVGKVYSSWSSGVPVEITNTQNAGA